MSLYEHIVRSNDKESSKVLPNPMNAMRAHPDPSLKSFAFTALFWSQIGLFIFFVGYLLYTGFLANLEQRSQEKAAEILSEKNRDEALLSNVYAAQDKKKTIPEGLESFLSDKPLRDKESYHDRGPDFTEQEVISWMSKNPGVEVFSPGNEQALKASAAPQETLTDKLASPVENAESKPTTVSVTPSAPPKIEGIFKVEPPVVQSYQDSETLKQRVDNHWHKALADGSSSQLQELVKMVGAKDFSDFFQDKFSRLEQENWIAVVDFCLASSKAFQGDKDRASVVLSCSDYFTDRGEYQQALALYSYQPVMQSHQDFYSRLAYVALKNEKFTQAVGVYQRLLQLDPKNARWWLGLGWAFRGQGEAKLAHDAYTKAYKYALPGAEFKPFLQSVLQDG